MMCWLGILVVLLVVLLVVYDCCWLFDNVYDVVVVVVYGNVLFLYFCLGLVVIVVLLVLCLLFLCYLLWLLKLVVCERLFIYVNV